MGTGNEGPRLRYLLLLKLCQARPRSCQPDLGLAHLEADAELSGCTGRALLGLEFSGCFLETPPWRYTGSLCARMVQVLRVGGSEMCICWSGGLTLSECGTGPRSNAPSVIPRASWGPQPKVPSWPLLGAAAWPPGASARPAAVPGSHTGGQAKGDPSWHTRPCLRHVRRGPGTLLARAPAHWLTADLSAAPEAGIETPKPWPGLMSPRVGCTFNQELLAEGLRDSLPPWISP